MMRKPKISKCRFWASVSMGGLLVGVFPRNVRFENYESIVAELYAGLDPGRRGRHLKRRAVTEERIWANIMMQLS